MEAAKEIRTLVLYEARHDGITHQTGVAVCVWCEFLRDAHARMLSALASTNTALL